MNNFLTSHIVSTIEMNYKTVPVKKTAQILSSIGADQCFNLSDFIVDHYLPAMQECNNGLNQECVCYAAKVLAKITQD